MRFLICLFPSVLLLASLTASAATDVAIVKRVSGAPRVVRGGTSEVARLGMRLFEADRIVAGAAETIGIIFNDGTTLSAGPSTELDLRQYTYDPAAAKYAFSIYLKKGTLSYTSGRLARLAPGAVRLDTPRTSVGVRGTRLALRHEEGGSK